MGRETFTPRQQRFLRTWEQHRKSKWKYVLLQGSVTYGFPTAMIMYFWDQINFNIHLFNVVNFLVYVFPFAFLLGIPFGFYLFWLNEKTYKALKDSV
jgi:hypothetical protein